MTDFDPGLYTDLAWRGLVSDCTHHAELTARLSTASLTLYCGFDPTADSLHVGSLVPLLALRRFQLAGHRPIALAGGATGMIGDPSGKSKERNLLDSDALAHNIRSVSAQLARFLDFTPGSNAAMVLNNHDWLGRFSFLEFLRDVGKAFTVNAMIAKESVRQRMEDRDVGISYTEFSYMLLQAYDFFHLRSEHGCVLQIGGSDQWGNITAGTDFIRRRGLEDAFGLTLPLITNSDGTKFGKTEAGAVWLDSNRTSVYRFYQFWIRVDDRDVVRYLKYFTFLPRVEIERLEAANQAKPEGREAHIALARAVTDLVHGEVPRREAEAASAVLFGGDPSALSAKALEEIVGEIPAFDIPAERWSEGVHPVDLLVMAGLSASKGQARKDVEGGGVYVNNQPISRDKPTVAVDLNALLHGRYLLVRKGKRNYAVGHLKAALS